MDSLTPPRRFLVFRSAGRRQGVSLETVERAVRAAAITPIPDAPPAMLGVLDVAGEVLPVLSIPRRFGLEHPPVAPDHHFLIARMGSRRVVLPVEAALGVIEGPAVVDSEAVVPGLEGFRGLAQLDDGLVVLHDLERFFSPEEWRRLDGAMRAGLH